MDLWNRNLIKRQRDESEQIEGDRLIAENKQGSYGEEGLPAEEPTEEEPEAEFGIPNSLQ